MTDDPSQQACRSANPFVSLHLKLQATHAGDCLAMTVGAANMALRQVRKFGIGRGQSVGKLGSRFTKITLDTSLGQSKYRGSLRDANDVCVFSKSRRKNDPELD